MKRVMVLIMLLLCINTYGQLYQAMPQPGYGPVKRMWIDSVLIVPTNVTSGDNLSGGREVGKIRYNITDSSLQAWTGYQWRSGGSISAPAISSLTAATATNNIDNLNYLQQLRWDTHTGLFPGMLFGSSSTVMGTTGSALVRFVVNGANASSNRTSTTVEFSSERSGTGSVNNAAMFSAINGATNNAINVTAGNVLLSPLTASTILQLDANKNIASATTGTGVLTLIGGTSSGSGGLVGTTSPSFVTSVIGGASFDAFNTVSTTLNIGGAATTMTIGGTPTTAITHNYSTNATAAATTKTINLGTGGAASSTTNINIGSANGGTTTVNSPTLAATIFNASTGFRIGGAATSRKMLVGNGTNFVASTETWAVPGTSGNVLTSDGTNWISAAPAGGMAIGGSITSATQGSVLFAGASGVLAQDNSNLFWDNTNKRLAIGSTTTTFDIDVRKTTDGSVGFGVQNASGGTSAAAVFQLGRSYGADYYVSHYYAGDGNTVYTPLSYNIINASGSTGGMNLVNIANASMTFGTSNTTRMTISGAGAVRMHTYGAGAATFDASGNITSVSDIRLKNIQGYYGVGLKQLMQINPIVYKWKPSSGMETKHDYIGFSAQNIRSSLGEDAIGINKQGYLSIQDRAILAVAINAIQELKELNDKQQKEIDNLKQIIKNK